MPVGTKGRPTRLAAKRLNAFMPSMLPIADQRVDLGIRDVIVATRGSRASEPLCSDALGRAARAFELVPGYWRWAYGCNHSTAGRLLHPAGTRHRRALKVFCTFPIIYLILSSTP